MNDELSDEIDEKDMMTGKEHEDFMREMDEWAESVKTVCYLCGVKDPNETHYDPNEHHICLTCGVKLYEVAGDGLEFDIRGDTVLLVRQRQAILPADDIVQC